MRAIVSLLALSLLCACSGQSTEEDAMSGKTRLHYPVTRQGDQVDHYFGQAGLQELAGNATMLFYMTEEGQEGRNAFNEKRRPDFSKYKRNP